MGLCALDEEGKEREGEHLASGFGFVTCLQYLAMALGWVSGMGLQTTAFRRWTRWSNCLYLRCVVLTGNEHTTNERHVPSRPLAKRSNVILPSSISIFSLAF